MATLVGGPALNLVLLDVVLPGMPGMDGFHVLHHIRHDANLRDVPVSCWHRR
jgi:CheY-like chemotaxis protein